MLDLLSVISQRGNEVKIRCGLRQKLGLFYQLRVNIMVIFSNLELHTEASRLKAVAFI